MSAGLILTNAAYIHSVTYHKNPVISDWHRQIILGAVLGGSSIVRPKGGRNDYLAMRGRDHRWLRYKADELKVLSASQTPFREEGSTLRWHSSCYPVFSEMRAMFYDGEGKRCIDPEALDMLRDIGMAVWYCDRGKIVGGRAVFNTYMHGECGTEVAARYFNTVGIEAEVFRERGKLKVRLTDGGTCDLFKTIAHRVPAFMLDRISCPTEGRTPSPPR